MRRVQTFFLLTTVLLMTPAVVFAQGTEEPLTVLLSWGEPEVPEPFFGPEGIATDRWGNVYVTDRDEYCVWKFDANGAYLTRWGGPGSDPGEFEEPHALDVDENGFVYVVDGVNDRIQKFDSEGNFVLQWYTAWGTGPSAQPFFEPWGIAVSESGDVYVSDLSYHGIFAFDSQGNPIVHWGGQGSAFGEFYEPHGIDVGPTGNVYVADTMNRRIQVFDGSGVYLWSWRDGDPDINLREVLDLAVDSFGNVYFMDEYGEFMRKFGPDGSDLSVLDEFRESRGVAVFGYGTVYGVDQYNNEVRKCGYPPTLTSIVDVGDDQGRSVRLSWTPTLLDMSTMPTVVTGYGVYRRIDDKIMEAWDFVATVPARGDTVYNLVAPTLCDSTESGVCWSVFAVTAFTPYGEFYDSPPDSGYSIDNLPPGVPAAPIVEEIEGALELRVSWDANAAPDLGHYAVYRGATPDFTPADPDLPDFETYDLTIVDAAVSPGETWYYRIGAFDDAGNFSGYSSATGVTVITGAAVPRRLELVGAVPNPFNPRTKIVFELPVTSEVELILHDLTGRVIRTLAIDTPLGPGRHELAWDGADEMGRAVASGVYVCRLRAAGEIRTTRLMLIR